MTKLPTGRHTQAIKSARKDSKRYLKNKSQRSRAKSLVREVRETVEQNPAEAAGVMVKAQKSLDKASAKGAIHKNKAARLKSRLNKKINRSKTGK